MLATQSIYLYSLYLGGKHYFQKHIVLHPNNEKLLFSNLTNLSFFQTVLTSFIKKVVISDVVTYYIGLGLRLGILKPLKKFIKVTDDVEEAGTTTTQTKPVRVRKRDKVKKVLEKSGNRVGFVTRLSVGFRGPLIFLTGYSNRVSIQNFLVGTSFGGIVSLFIQLFIGFSMSQSFKAKGMRDIGSRASKTMTTAAATTTMEGGEGLNVGVGLIGLRNLVLFSVVGVSTFLIQKYLVTNPSASNDGKDEEVVGEE